MGRDIDIGLSYWRTTMDIEMQHKLNALHVFCRLRDYGNIGKNGTKANKTL